MRFYKRLNPDGSTRTVESYSHNSPVSGALEISQAEFDAFLTALPPPPPLPNYRAEWEAAATVADKLRVLARKLELV